jgi:hypothetical protein
VAQQYGTPRLHGDYSAGAVISECFGTNDAEKDNFLRITHPRYKRNRTIMTNAQIMKLMLLIGFMAWCAGCGPGAESELQALGANCFPSARLAKSDSGLDGKTLTELIEACNQRRSALDTATIPKQP